MEPATAPRLLAAGLIFASVGGLFAACSTGAVGVDACRAIESARCDAVPACEGDDPSFGIATEEQIANCKTFYRDHCLVGIENTDEEPSQDDINDCVDTIGAIGACQTKGVETMEECLNSKGNSRMVEGQEALSPCEALASPELIKDCAFVAATEDEDE